MTALYTFGQFQYSYEKCTGAADYPNHFHVLSTNNDLNNWAHWGKFALDILTGRWEVVLEELNTLRKAVDLWTSSSLYASASANANNLPEPALAHLQLPTWLVHWSLIVYLNHLEERTLLLQTLPPLTPSRPLAPGC
jgi:translation initiation factor 3 subunit E